METKDLTPKNLGLLIDICTRYCGYNPDVLYIKLTKRENPEKTFLTILYYINQRAYTISEFKDSALFLIYRAPLKIMPKFINYNPFYTNEPETQTAGSVPKIYSWVPIIARWRLKIGS